MKTPVYVLSLIYGYDEGREVGGVFYEEIDAINTGKRMVSESEAADMLLDDDDKNPFRLVEYEVEEHFIQ